MKQQAMLPLMFIYSFIYAPIKLPTKPACLFFNTGETLHTIRNIIAQKTKGAYLRFGDGDVYLANGIADMLQKPTYSLSREMQEAFAIEGETVLKTLPIHNKKWKTVEKNMFYNNHESTLKACKYFFKSIQQFTGYRTNRIYSTVALHYQATYYPEACASFLRFLKKNHCILIGNKNIPREIIDLLFGVGTSHIPTPDNNSYTEIDRIEKEALQALAVDNQYTVIVTAMGCSGRILQKRLWHQCANVFLFDFGSLLDALCGWNTRAWIPLSHFDKDKLKALLY